MNWVLQRNSFAFKVITHKNLSPREVVMAVTKNTKRIQSPRLRAKSRGSRVWFVVSYQSKGAHRGGAWSPLFLRTCTLEGASRRLNEAVQSFTNEEFQKVCDEQSE
jgi:hypothetical protein